MVPSRTTSSKHEAFQKLSAFLPKGPEHSHSQESAHFLTLQMGKCKCIHTLPLYIELPASNFQDQKCQRQQNPGHISISSNIVSSNPGIMKQKPQPMSNSEVNKSRMSEKGDGLKSTKQSLLATEFTIPKISSDPGT